MRKEESKALTDMIWHAINKKGIPINVRTGQNADAADWFRDLLARYIDIDEPIGIISGGEYDSCPRCMGIIGSSAYYCKKCGAWLREEIKR